MANKYSKYQLQPYVSQYVDPQRTKIAETLRSRYESNLAGHSGVTNAVSSIKVGAGDQHIKDDAVEQVSKDFESVIKNNNYEDAGLVVAQSQQNLMANEGLVTASQSYNNWENEQKVASEIKMKTGKNMLFGTEYERDENGVIVRNEKGVAKIINKFDKHQSYYQDENTGEMVKNVYQSTAQAQLQYSDKMQAIIENIAGDPVALQKLADNAGFENPSELYGYLVYGSEVSEEKAVALAKGLSDVYINGSDEGSQQMLKLTTAVGDQNINPATGDNWDADDAEAIIQDEMIAIARQQVGSQLQYMTDQVYIAKMKNQAAAPKKLQTFNSDATTNSQVLTGLDFIDIDDDFNENGKLSTDSYDPSTLQSIVSLGSDTPASRRAAYRSSSIDSGLSSSEADAEMATMESEYQYDNLVQLGAYSGTIDEWRELTDAAKNSIYKKRSTLLEEQGINTLREKNAYTKKEREEMLTDLYGGPTQGSGSDVYDRQKTRFDREMEASKEEGRPPRLSIVGANKYIYLEHMKENYPEVLAASKTDKAFFKNLAHIQEAYEVSSTKVYKPTNKYTEGFREMILSSPTDYIVRREDGSFTNNLDDLQMELGYKNGKGNWDDADSQKLWSDMMKESKIQGLMTGGQKPGSFAMSMTDSDGKNRTVELANSNEAQQQFMGPHEIINDLQSGRAQDYRTSETAKTIQTGKAMLANGTIVDAEMKVHYEINTETMEWEPVITQYNYTEGTKTQAVEPEELRRQGSGVIDYLMEQAVNSYMSLHHLVGTDMNDGKGTDLSNPAS